MKLGSSRNNTNSNRSVVLKIGNPRKVRDTKKWKHKDNRKFKDSGKCKEEHWKYKENGKFKENGRYRPQLPEDFRDVTVRD